MIRLQLRDKLIIGIDHSRAVALMPRSLLIVLRTPAVTYHCHATLSTGVDESLCSLTPTDCIWAHMTLKIDSGFKGGNRYYEG
jgi:hypothetical protein